MGEFNRRFAGSPRKLGREEAERYLALILHNVAARESRLMLPEEEEAIPFEVDFLYSVAKAGKGPLQEWLEDAALQGKYLRHLDDSLYHDAYPPGFNDSNIIKVAGCLVGTDKIDHFFDQGYAYWRVSTYGQDDRRAVDYGVASELGWYGIAVAGVFSYADLRANWAGYRFFKNLGGYFRLDARQHMSQSRQFDWAEWVDWQWDEWLNPSALTQELLKKMADYAAWHDRNQPADSNDPRFDQTCRALNASAQAGLRRSQEYLNDKVPTDLPTNRQLVASVAAGYLVAGVGRPGPGL
jgi:hypothetical protein